MKQFQAKPICHCFNIFINIDCIIYEGKFKDQWLKRLNDGKNSILCGFWKWDNETKWIHIKRDCEIHLQVSLV